MSSMVEDRIQVGTSDKGNVFIFHFAEKGDYTDALENHRYEVRAGNHTILTTSDRAAAETVANALCGIKTVFVPAGTYEETPEPTPKPSPVMEKYIAETREKVSKK